MSDKVWKISGYEPLISDGQLIALIKANKISPNVKVTCKDMKVWVPLKNSIYQFYFKKENSKDASV